MWYHIIVLFLAYFEPVWFCILVIYWALPKHIILSGNTTMYRVFRDTKFKLLLKLYNTYSRKNQFGTDDISWNHVKSSGFFKYDELRNNIEKV